MSVALFGAAGRVSLPRSTLSSAHSCSLVGKTPPLSSTRRTCAHQQVALRRQLATRSSGGARLAAFKPSSTRSVAGGMTTARKPHPPKAVWACKSIRPERSLEQGAPGLPSRSLGSTRSAGEYLCNPSLALVPRSGPNPGHNEWSPRRTRREHAVIEHLILVGWGNQRGEPFHELCLAEHEGNRSIRPGTL